MVALGLSPLDEASRRTGPRRLRGGNRPDCLQAGLLFASRFLGDAYVCGLGIAQSYEEAVLAYKESVEKGDVSSSVQLGHMYAAGCAPPNYEAAFAAYTVAADQGDPEAQVSLSGLFARDKAWSRAHTCRISGPGSRSVDFRLAGCGSLRTPKAKQAARLMSAVHVKDADAFVDSIIVAGSKPMH